MRVGVGNRTEAKAKRNVGVRAKVSVPVGLGIPIVKVGRSITGFTSCVKLGDAGGHKKA